MFRRRHWSSYSFLKMKSLSLKPFSSVHMTFQGVHIKVSLSTELCPPATLDAHMMSLCFLLLSVSVSFSFVTFSLCHLFLSLQMQGVVKVDGESEQKFIEGTLAEVSSPAPAEPQTPMDTDKASIYR